MIAQQNGYVQELHYGAKNTLASVTDSYDRMLTFTPGGNGLIEKITTPDDTSLTYAYTIGSGTKPDRLTTVTYSTSPATKQTHLYGNSSFPYAMTAIVDEDNNLYSTWSYDSLSRGQTSQQGSGANLTTFTYNANGTTTVTNALGVADTYAFTTLQGISKVTKISRAATSTTAAATETFGYDSNGYLNSQTDWNGNKTTYVNNANGNPTTINEGVGSIVARTTEISYDPTWVHEPHQIITPGLTSTFAYDSNGNPNTRTDLDTTTNTAPYSTKGQSRVTTWEWNSTGQLTSFRLPRTDVTAETSFTYDGSGALIQTKNALGHLTKVTAHTGGGLPLTIVDPNNVTTTLAYDARLNLHTSKLTTLAGILTTTRTHDAANNLTAVQLPDGSGLKYKYDNAHRLTGITDLFGNSITYTLDKLGDRTLVETKNPTGTLTEKHSASFDALGRMLTNVGGEGQTTTYTYDSNGNVRIVAPPAPSGKITYAYDALNRQHTTEDPAPGGTTTINYDAHDRVLSVEDANGNTTSYVYDGFGDRTQTASPDSGISVAHFDGDRNVTQVVRPGPLTAVLTYDALDRPLKTNYPADATLTVSRSYDQSAGHGDGIGRLTSVTDQVGSLSLVYDERGNVTSESRSITGEGTLVTGTTFDKASRVTQIAYPSGTQVDYARDIMGRITGITTKVPGSNTAIAVVSGVSYEPFGPEAGLTFGNGVTGEYGFDLDYRPTTRLDKGKAAIQNLTYGYYTNDSVEKIADAVNPANTQTLAYDALDRLTSGTSDKGGYGAISYGWDPVSNIETQTVNGTKTTYGLVSKSNKLASETTGSTTDAVSSTAAGNISSIKAGSTTLDAFTYNQANQLASAQTSSTFATYKYDFSGQRLEKARSGDYPILYQYSRTGGELLSENDLHKGQTADYVYLNGRPIGEVNPTTGALYFTHTDRLGTPQKVTDSTQAVVWSALYQPFGGATFAGTFTTQSLRLPGQRFDPETGLYHNGFRDYAPGLTRYIESDPIGLAGGANTYQYAGGEPENLTDRLGLDPFGPLNQSIGRLLTSRLTPDQQSLLYDRMSRIPAMEEIAGNPDGGYYLMAGAAAGAGILDLAAVGGGAAASWVANSTGLLGAAEGRVFWSAIGAQKAIDWATENGGSTLEMCPLGRLANWVQSLPFVPQNSLTGAAWNALSSGFASGATGPVTYLQGAYLGTNWLNTELPILEQNGNPITIVPLP